MTFLKTEEQSGKPVKAFPRGLVAMIYRDSAGRLNLAQKTSILITLFIFLGCSVMGSIPPPDEEALPSWAPDSRHLVYECYLDGPIKEGSSSIFDLAESEAVYQSFFTKEASDICVYDFDEQNQVRMIEDKGGDWHPTWSPTGSHIAYLRQDGVYLITPDGNNQRRLVLLPPNSYDSTGLFDSTNINWSPDGTQLLFSSCLDHLDRDVYVVNIETGLIKNLTPDSRMQDIAPMWTLDGTKIVFLSTTSALLPGTCRLKRDAPHQLKIVDVDGKNGRILFDKENFYAFISVTNDGNIVFVTDMNSKSVTDYSRSSIDPSVYKMELEANEPMLVYSLKKDDLSLVPFSLSPNGRYMAYRSFSSLKILDLSTGLTFELPPIEPFVDTFVWAPNSQKVAATISIQRDMAIDEENHIYIFDVNQGVVHPLLQDTTAK